MVSQQQSFHVGAVIKDVLDYSQDLVPVFELNGKQVNINYDVHYGDRGYYTPLHVLLSSENRGLAEGLADQHFVDLVEYVSVRFICVLFGLALHDLVQTIKVFLVLF